MVHHSLIVGGDIIWTVTTAAAEVIDVREGGRKLLVRDQIRHQDHRVTVSGDTWARVEAATPGLEERQRLCRFGYTLGGKQVTVTEPYRRLARVVLSGQASGFPPTVDYAWETIAEAAGRGYVLPS